MNQPLFSVLIANYNNGRYLQDAINSVLAQTYKFWEIIIVDDGSTDNSIELYNKYKDDNRFHIYFNGENKGCGFTKSKCVECANGMICGFLDSDDVLLPNAITEHVKAHTQHLDYSCVFSRFYYCDTNLNIIRELRELNIPTGQNYFTNRDYLPEHFTSFKKIHYDKTIGIDPSLPAAVDQDLYFKLEEIAPVFLLNKLTYKYRCTDNQISQNKNWTKAFYWNLIVRHNTCKRRGLEDEAFSVRDLSDMVESIQANSAVVQNELHKITSSYHYKICYFVFHPISWLKKNHKK